MGTVLVSDGVWDQGNWDALGAGDSPAVGWSLGDALGAGDGSAVGWPWGVRSRPREHSELCERGEPGWPCLTWGHAALQTQTALVSEQSKRLHDEYRTQGSLYTHQAPSWWLWR